MSVIMRSARMNLRIAEDVDAKIRHAAEVAGVSTSPFVARPAGTPAAVDRADLPERHARGMPRHPIRVILLARLAIDRTLQGQGYGKALVADASIRALQAADLIGARALLVHARDDNAATFYERLG